MSAYLFIDLDVHDKQGFQRYRDAVPSFIAKQVVNISPGAANLRP